MHCKLSFGQFLINGLKCQVSLNEEFIKFWPTSSASSNGGQDKGCTKIEFDRVIGLRKVVSEGRNRSPEQCCCSKLKVYYAKQNSQTSGQLLKLKKLTVELHQSSRKHQNQQSTKESLNGNQQVVRADSESESSQSASLSSSLATVSTAPTGSSSVTNKSSVEKSQVTNELDQLHESLEDFFASKRDQRPKRLLVFVNPFGGKGKALPLYRQHVKRLFEIANIEAKLVVTQHANHARDTLEDPLFDVEYFDGIVCIGGDGMFSELMNGLLFRYNRHVILDSQYHSMSKDDEATEHDGILLTRANLDKCSATTNQQLNEKMIANSLSNLGGIGKSLLSPPIPIGVIGAGSTDANLFGIMGTNDVITATLNIILGKQINIDICSLHSVKNQDKLLRFVSTFIGYGYFGDVIRESEKLRWLGPSRYDVTGVNNLLKNRTYRGSIKILVSKEDGSPLNVKERCHTNCNRCIQSSSPRKEQLAQDLKLIERQGSFVGVNAAVTACRCPQTKKGFSPGNHLANGCVDLILIRPCTRLQYIQYLFRTGWTKKSAFDLKYVEAFRCRQFEFVAQSNDFNESGSITTAGLSSSSTSDNSDTSSSRANSLESESRQPNYKHKNDSDNVLTSSWNADGEILEEQSIRVKVNNQLLRVFGTGEPLRKTVSNNRE